MTVDDLVRGLAAGGWCAPDGQQDMERAQLALLRTMQRTGGVARLLATWYGSGVLQRRAQLPAFSARLAVAALATAVNFCGADRLERLLAAELAGCAPDDE